MTVDLLLVGAVVVLVVVCVVVWRLVRRRRHGVPARGRVVRRPGRGEIWSAMVPFEKGSYEPGEQRAKDRPCLVISTFARHAYVLKITSADQGDRPGYLRLAAGWHPRSEKESWIKVESLLKVPLRDFREYVRDSPRSLWRALEKLYPADATPSQHMVTPRTRRSTRRKPASRSRK